MVFNLFSRICFMLWLYQVNGCTEVIVKAKDKSVIVGRSIEFYIPLESVLKYNPVNATFDAHVPQNICNQTKKLTWKNKYRVLRAVLKAVNFVTIDGINSAGLSVANLYLPGYTVFEDITAEDCHNAVSQYEFVNYVLGNFRSVQQIMRSIRKGKFPKVWGQKIGGVVHPAHWDIVDETGKAIVIEYVKRGRMVYKNKLGVLTNSPEYDYHINNMKNYVNLRRRDHDSIKFNGVSFNQIGAGSGSLGLPGDFTPPGRFVRAAVILGFAKKPDTNKEAVNLAFHILNTVDIVDGVVLHSKGAADKTQMLYVKDLKNRRIYYRSYDDLSIRRADLAKLTENQTMILDLKGDFEKSFTDFTESFKAQHTSI